MPWVVTLYAGVSFWLACWRKLIVFVVGFDQGTVTVMVMFAPSFDGMLWNLFHHSGVNMK